ncbi:MAG: hypothetical protein RL491_1, partial [Bacteroidota bacterium]
MIAKKTATFFLAQLLILLFQFQAFGQKKTYSSSNAQAIRFYESGLEYYDKSLNEKAKIEMEKAIKKDSGFIEPYLILADMAIESRKYDEAILSYKKVIAINPTFYPAAYYTLAAIEFKTGKYADALRHYDSYKTVPGTKSELLSMTEFRISCCKFALDAIKTPVEFDPKNLGVGVNSIYDEYFPSITVDDETMIFTRNRPETQGSTRFHEDFYIANR